MPVKPSLSLGTELYFGAGRIGDLPDVAGQYGGRVLIVTGPAPLAEAALGLVESLRRAGVEATEAAIVTGEPTIAMVEKAIGTAREFAADVLVGFGGGSCLDTAKAAAGILPSGGAVSEFFGGRELAGPGLPWVAVPTTAGSGAEVTPNAVLTDPQAKVKQSIRGGTLLAKAAIVDPGLSLGLPAAQTAYSGMDALSHAVEALVSQGANELTEIMALEAARLIWTNLPRAYADGGDLGARSALAKASLLAGIALANARLGAVHGLAHPIGVLYNLPHGLVCAVLLPQIMRFNLQAGYEKYARLAEILGLASGGDVFDRAAAAIRHLMGLCRRLGIPATLKPLGLAAADLPFIVEQALTSSSLAANPRRVTSEDLRELLEQNI